MLVLLKANLVLLAVPKTGTTALAGALRPHADMIFAKETKHLTARRYRNKVEPFLKSNFDATPETVAVMRHPVEQLRSWYRYRQRPETSPEKSTLNMSFDEFIAAVVKHKPPEVAAIGSQFQFLNSFRGKLLVDHLFSYETLPDLVQFFEHRLQRPLELQSRNVSPKTPATLSSDMAEKLRAARPREFALYERLSDAGGYLGILDIQDAA